MSLHDKMRDLMKDFAKAIAPDHGTSLKQDFEKIFKEKGLKMDKSNLSAFNEGLNYAFQLNKYFHADPKKFDEMMVISISFLELFISEAKN